MAFQTTIAASHFSGIAVSRVAIPATVNEANLKNCFNLPANFVAIENIRDIPAVGATPNIVKVPTYGLAQTLSVGAQGDSPDLEMTINYVPAQWAGAGATFATTGTLGDAVADGTPKVFQLAILPGKPASYAATAGGVGTVPNTLFYWVGKIESISIQPARDDATTATVALSTSSTFYGPYTV